MEASVGRTGAMSRYLARWKLTAPQWKLPSAGRSLPRRDVGLPRGDVAVSGAMEAYRVTMEASFGREKPTASRCWLTSWRCRGIWRDGSLPRRNGSFHQPGEAYRATMSAYLVAMSRYLARWKLPSAQRSLPRCDVGLSRDEVSVFGPMEAYVATKEASIGREKPTAPQCRLLSWQRRGIRRDGSLQRAGRIVWRLVSRDCGAPAVLP